MRYKVSFPDDEKYAHIRVTETIVPSLAQEIVEEMVRIRKQNAVQRFLLDVREVRAQTSPFDDYEIAYERTKSSGLDGLIKVALLRNPLDTTHSFAEIVGRNAGHNITLFEDMGTAVAWLQDET